MSLLSRTSDAAKPGRCRRNVHSVSRSHVGRVRRINEDRVFEAADAGVWAVVDGMGGHSDGDLAAQQVIDHLRIAVADPLPVTPARVRRALEAANAAIVARNRETRLDAGATVVAAILAEDMIDIAWAGDSRAYRIGNGRLEQLTRDHSVVQQLVDAGAITPAMAEHHPQAHVVTRALGVDAAIILDSVRIDLCGDRILLCSDGLCRSLRADDVAGNIPLAALADRLMANALERDGTDNLSLVLFEVG